MDWNLIEGNWNQLKVRIKDEWGQLTDDDLDKIAGKRVAELYGISEAMAEEEIDDWMVVEEYRPKSLGS